MYYILFDDSGSLITRHIYGLSTGPVPDGAVEVSEDLFWKTINEIDGIWKRHWETGEISKHPLPPSVPIVVDQVTRAQGKAALITAGLWPKVEAYMAKIADPIEKALALVALNDTSHWRRDSPTMQAIATELQITSEQMDSLFIQAAAIQL